MPSVLAVPVDELLVGDVLVIKPGERIVTAGVNSLKPGQKVKIDEDSPR